MKLYAHTECTGAWPDDRLTVRLEYGEKSASSAIVITTLRETDEKWPDGSRRTVVVDDLADRLIDAFTLLIRQLDKKLREQ